MSETTVTVILGFILVGMGFYLGWQFAIGYYNIREIVRGKRKNSEEQPTSPAADASERG